MQARENDKKEEGKRIPKRNKERTGKENGRRTVFCSLLSHMAKTLCCAVNA
jgi:hypothetical protein